MVAFYNMKGSIGSGAPVGVEEQFDERRIRHGRGWGLKRAAAYQHAARC